MIAHAAALVFLAAAAGTGIVSTGLHPNPLLFVNGLEALLRGIES